MTPYMLRQYTQLTEFLGRVLGPDYEVAFHDLSDPDHSLVAISNNGISNRGVGSPLTESALKMLDDSSCQNQDYRVHYRGRTSSGKPLRSSTMIIKDEQGEPAGLLCINFDDQRYQEVSEKILGLCHPDTFLETSFLYDEELLSPGPEIVEAEPSPRTVDTSAFGAVERALRDRGLDHHHMSLDDRMDVIEQLNSQGIFLLKGAVKDVADALDCSPASVYRYLSNLHKD